MKIVKIERSSEECQMAGWRGVDIYFDRPVNEKMISHWECLGKMLFLSQLKQPFYKISGRTYQIKGVLGRDHLRVGASEEFGQVYDKAVMEEFLRLSSMPGNPMGQ